MGFVVVFLLILFVLIALQMFLSLRKNRFFGLALPGLNLLVSLIVCTQFSDLVVAAFGFFVTIVPMAIWLSIYSACRNRVERRHEAEINRMRINDL